MTPTYRIQIGDCRVELKSLAECSIDSIVTDPPYELSGLKQRVGFPMARVAQGNEISKIVCREVVAVEQAIGLFVVNVISRPKAMLTGAVVASARLALLCLPVWATIPARASQILRMQDADPVGVTAWTRAKFSLAAHIANVTRRTSKATPATQTTNSDLLSQLVSNGCMLTLRRAGFAAPVFESCIGYLKWLATCLAFHRNFHCSIIEQKVGRVYA